VFGTFLEVYLGNNILAESKESRENAGGGSSDDDSEVAPWLPAWLSFLSGLPTDRRKRCVLVMSQAYVDESGGKEQGEVFTFSSLSGTAEKVVNS
jgi:hypothetical protein